MNEALMVSLKKSLIQWSEAKAQGKFRGVFERLSRSLSEDR